MLKQIIMFYIYTACLTVVDYEKCLNGNIIQQSAVRKMKMQFKERSQCGSVLEARITTWI